jgi:hypothetical protein
MTDKATIEYARRTIKLGHFHTVPRGKWRTQYELRINKRSEVQAIIELLLPYLVTKRAQATLLLEFCKGHTKETAAASFGRDFALMNELRRLNNAPDEPPQ